LLNSLLPALIISWGAATLLFRWLQKAKSAWLRFLLRIAIFLLTFVVGLIGGFAVFFLSIWAMSGMSLSEFVNAPFGAGQQITSWARLGLSGAFVGALIGQFRKWGRD